MHIVRVWLCFAVANIVTHAMETVSALLALCEGNPPVTDISP